MQQTNPALAQLSLLLGVSFIASPVIAQVVARPAAQTQTAVIYGACNYVSGDTAYFSGIFSVAPGQRGPADRAFRQYAQTQTGVTAPKAVCQWSPTQERISTIREAEKRMLGLNGFPAKGVDVSWHFDPNAAPQTQSSAASAAAARSNSVVTGTATQTSAVTRTNVAPSSVAANKAASPASSTTSSNGVVSTTPTGNSITGAGASAVSGMTQSVQQTGQSMKDGATSAMTGTVTSMTSSATAAMQGATANMQSKLSGMFSRKKTAATPSDTAQNQVPANGVASSAVAPTNPGGTVAPPPQTSITVAMQSGNASAPPTSVVQSDGINFVFCQLKASGSEYYSDIFPSMEANDNSTRVAFWQQIAQQYKVSNIPFRDNVTCVRSANEADATASRKAKMDSASQRGLSPAQEIDTKWTFAGTPAR